MDHHILGHRNGFRAKRGGSVHQHFNQWQKRDYGNSKKEKPDVVICLQLNTATAKNIKIDDCCNIRTEKKSNKS